MTQRTLLSSNAKTQCRICLQNQQIDRLISPCQCKGSIQYVHRTCLKEYFQHKYKQAKKQQRTKMKQQLQCQICKSPIHYFRVKPQKRCITCSEMKDHFQAQDIFFLILYLIMYIGFHIVGIILILQESSISKIIGAIWLGASIIGFNYGLYKIISHSLIVRQASIVQLQ